MPLDKAAHADRRRRVRTAPAPVGDASTPMPEPEAIAPRLRELMAQYPATGLPSAYVHRAVTSPEAGIDGEEASR